MRILTLSVLVALIVSSCCLFHQKADKETSDIAGIIPYSDNDKGAYAMEARYSNWPNPDTMVIYIDGQRYKMSKMGQIFNLNGELIYEIHNEYPIAQLFFVQRSRDLFVFYTDMADSGVGSFVKRLSLDSGKIIWQTELDGFSFSKPLIKGQFAYIGTIGFIGKLKLKNGSFDWKYSWLDQKERINQFRNIDFIDSRKIRFVAPHPFTIKSGTVIVNDITGELIKTNF